MKKGETKAKEQPAVSRGAARQAPVDRALEQQVLARARRAGALLPPEVAAKPLPVTRAVVERLASSPEDAGRYDPAL
jgi:hypothetical protein